MRVPFCLVVVGVFLLMLRWPTLSLALAQVARTITVDQHGGGDYRTVQSAVDAVPDGNSRGLRLADFALADFESLTCGPHTWWGPVISDSKSPDFAFYKVSQSESANSRWVRIHVKQGSRELQVTISSQKSFILLEGDGSFNTDINFDRYGNGTDEPAIAPITDRQHLNLTELSPTYMSATFTVHADNFVARNIAFKNTFTGGLPAVAALIDGDKGAFYDCAFHGHQDTLSDLYGRHYFHHCLVEGAVDFIFGYGQSIYEDCTLMSNMPAWSKQPGWVTAHGRMGAAGRNAALVFKGGAITGSGRQYLGRPWNGQATVVFYQMNMASIVVPQGWDKWNSGQDVSQVTFAEVGCMGQGSSTAGRVPWEKHLSYAEVQRFVDIRFIDDGWLSNQP